MAVLGGEIELLGGIFEAVVERCARSARRYLLLIHLCQRAGRHLAHACREDYRLALLDRYLEIAGHPEVLGVGHAALKVLDIFNVFIPVGIVDPLGLARELHVERGETFVHTCRHAVVGRQDFAVEGIVGHTQRVALAESEERPELQRRGRMGLHERVADKDTVFVRDENLLLGQYHAAHAECGAGHAFTVELTDIFMSVGIVDSTLIAVQPQVEGRAVLNHRLVEARQQHMGLVAHLRDRHHKKAVLLSGVAAGKRGAMVGTRLVCAQHFLGQ